MLNFVFAFVLFFQQLFWLKGCLHLNVKKKGIKNFYVNRSAFFHYLVPASLSCLYNFPVSIMLLPKKLNLKDKILP